MSRFAEVYSASYRIDAQFSGLRYIMFHFPVTAAIFGTSLNMFILAAILILSWYRFFATPALVDNDEDEDYKDPFEIDSGKEDSSEEELEEEPELLGQNVENLKDLQ